MPDGTDVPPTPPASRGHLVEIARVFLKLGCTSFGGPVAHLGYLHAEVVVRRRWLDDARYGDLVALCQALPGPASSQVVFALGMTRGGLAGALMASVCFTLPSALLMLAFGYGIARTGDLRGAGWLHGLKLAAVAVVTQAVWAMGKKLCSDRARLSLSLVSAGAILVWPGAVTQLVVIALGAVAGWVLFRHEAVAEPRPATDARAHIAAAAALGVFAVLLLALPVLATATGSRAVAMFDSFFRAGAMVFGGGHVVLPLLRAELVPRGWLTDAQFLAGYGAVQAVPGPLFSFAGYLGVVMNPGARAWVGGVLCLVGVFLPAWLLVGGALPFWQRLRARPQTQHGLAGVNASVVGVLLAALYDPVIVGSVRHRSDVAAALVAFGLLEHWKAPPWAVVAAMGAAGQWLLAT